MKHETILALFDRGTYAPIEAAKLAVKTARKSASSVWLSALQEAAAEEAGLTGLLAVIDGEFAKAVADYRANHPKVTKPTAKAAYAEMGMASCAVYASMARTIIGAQNDGKISRAEISGWSKSFDALYKHCTKDGNDDAGAGEAEGTEAAAAPTNSEAVNHAIARMLEAINGLEEGDAVASIEAAIDAAIARALARKMAA